MTYTMHRGEAVTSPRVLSLRMTHVHPDTQEHHTAAVVMFDVPRVTDRLRGIVGRAALDQLTAQGLPVGATNPLDYAKRYAFPHTAYSVHAVALTNDDTGETRTDYSETYATGGGTLPTDAVFIMPDGERYMLPAIDYTRPVD